MFIYLNLYKLLIVALLKWLIVSSDRMSEKIYENIEVESFCFRRLNATHQTGCASNPSGNVGIIQLIESNEDILWVTQNGQEYPYIAVMNETFFSIENLSKMRDSKRVSGILLLKSTESPPFPDHNFSPESSCPNENSGLYSDSKNPEYAHCKKSKWNPKNPVIGMLYEDYSIPIVLVSNDSYVNFIIDKCYKPFNMPKNNSERTWPLCAAEISTFMLAAKDSPTCMRRSSVVRNLNPVKYCDPVGGRNVITFLQPTNKNETVDDRSIVVIAARMDAVSLFDQISPGADSTVSGLVTLLAVAKTLSNISEEIKHFAPGKNVLFAIFNGETFDYIGSSRVVFDMERGVFPEKISPDWSQLAPINLAHISHFIELSQVAMHEQEQESKLWIHTDPISRKDLRINNLVQELISLLKETESGVEFSEVEGGLALPPASVQRFLRKDLNISSVVISNFENVFSNKFYMSQYDTDQYLSNSTASRIANLATSVSKAVYKLLTGKTPSDSLEADIEIVEELMDCYLKNASCKLFQEIDRPQTADAKFIQSEKPLSLYVGVDRDGNPTLITTYTRYLLAYLSGKQLEDRDASNCTSCYDDRIFNYDWMAGPDSNNSGICVRSVVKYTEAVSPAKVLDDWTTLEYSTWTESIWTLVSLRVFVRPNPSLECLTLGIGFGISLVSLLVVYSINKRSVLLFGPRTLVAC